MRAPIEPMGARERPTLLLVDSRATRAPRLMRCATNLFGRER